MADCDGARPGDEAAAWWRGPRLARAWAVIGARLEQTGLLPTGGVTVSGLDRFERRALSDLLGNAVLNAKAQVDLVQLDARLRERAGVGVVAAAEQVCGRPLVDRQAERARREARRSAPLEHAREWALDHPEVAPGLIEEWAEGLARDGILMRDPDPTALITDALRVIDERGPHHHDVPPIARTELAARLRGDAHALDDGRRLPAVILRLVRLLAGEAGGADEGGDPAVQADLPGLADPADLADGGPPGGRLLWEQVGVVTDRVSSTCLVLGLRFTPAGPGERLRHVTERDPAHLMWWHLDAGLQFASGQRVLVCENPRVLEAAAEIGVVGWGFVCTSGRPALVTAEVLARLRAAGARLLYHGDFDWPGVDMANDLVRRFDVEPWRMSAADYGAVPAQLELAGRRVEALWDPGLAGAMAHRGLAVHEESTLPDLLHGL